MCRASYMVYYFLFSRHKYLTYCEFKIKYATLHKDKINIARLLSLMKVTYLLLITIFTFGNTSFYSQNKKNARTK